MVCALLALLCVLETAGAPSSSRANRDALLSAGRFGLSNTLIVAHLPKTREPRYYLEYLTLRGLAELPVLMLERSGVSYAATYWSKSDWNAHAKATTPLGRVPVLRGVGPKQPHSLVKTTLAQSGTIVRYLGRALALDGGDVDYNLRPRADMWYETVVELFGSAKFDAAALDGDAMSEVRYAETSNRGGAWSPLERAMAVLHTFEDALPEAGAPQRGLLAALAAPRLTYADLALFLKLEALGDASLPRRFAALRRFRDWVARDPNVKAYLSSDRRIPRTVRRESPTPDYYYSRGAGGAIESESTTLRPGG
jgi:glutathione S-transferase